MGGGGNLLGCAVVLIIVVAVWVLGHMFPFFYVMKIAGLLRVDEAEERMGLDVSHHGGSAYEATQGADLLKGKADESEQALLTRCVSSLFLSRPCPPPLPPLLAGIGCITVSCMVPVCTNLYVHCAAGLLFLQWFPIALVSGMHE